MRRRDFLIQTGTMATAASLLPGAIGVAGARATSTHDFSDRVLVLVELNGGNDGLNTVIPYADPAYAAARPGLAIARDRVLQLDEMLGFHPALAPLMPAWTDDDLAVVLGVGYPRPDRSHFRSIEIWNTGAESDQVLQDGWAARAFSEADIARDLVADAIVLSGDKGPFFGRDMRTLVMNQPAQFVAQAGRVGSSDMEVRPTALGHILSTRAAVTGAAAEISQRLEAATPVTATFPQAAFGRQVEVAARIIAARIPVAAIKLTLGSFDTHAGQANRHNNLLSILAEGLAAFRLAMQASGDWDRVLVMTYAEFGRRVGQNGSAGTDHGTAAPHFLIGGRVRGGFYGRQPSLLDLDGGDLKYNMDYRSLFATASQNWWGLSPMSATFGGQRPINGLLA